MDLDTFISPLLSGQSKGREAKLTEEQKHTETYRVSGALVGGVKKGRFVIFAFPLFCSILEVQDTQMLGKTARKVSLSHPFLCAPSFL